MIMERMFQARVCFKIFIRSWKTLANLKLMRRENRRFKKENNRIKLI